MKKLFLIIALSSLTFANIDYYKVSKIEQIAKTIPNASPEKREQIQKKITKMFQNLSEEEKAYLKPRIEKIEKANKDKIENQEIESLNSAVMVSQDRIPKHIFDKRQAYKLKRIANDF